MSRDRARPRRRPGGAPTNGRSRPLGPGALAALADEATALLSRSVLQRSDMRWLRGEGVDVMLSPLQAPVGDDEARILLTVVPRREMDDDIGLLTVALTDGEGQVVRHSLGSDGQAALRVATPTYRLRVEAPTELGPAAVVPAVGRRRRRAAVTFAGVSMLVVALAVNLLVFPAAKPAVAMVNITDRCDELPAHKEPDQVVVAAVWSGLERVRFKKVLEQFTRQTRIKVTFATSTPAPDRNIGTTIAELTRRGCAPDVALLPQPGLLRELGRKGLLQPVDQPTADLVERNYATAWKELGSIDDQLYGVWFKAATKSNFWYSTEAFEQAGVAPPTDWQELKDAAATLAATGITPFAIGAKDGWTLTDWFENVYLRTAAPGMYQKLADREIPWTDPSVTVALRTLAEIFGHPEWIANGASGPRETSYEESVKLVFGEPRQAAMTFAGDFAVNEIDGTDQRVGKGAQVFPFPPIRPGSGSLERGQAQLAGGAAGGDVAVLMQHATDGGKQLLRYLATPEAAMPWVTAGGFSSPNRSIDLERYPHEVTRRSARHLVAADVTFDLSDLQPPSFGSTPGQGMGELLRTFFSYPTDVDSISRGLEAARRAAGP